jgi:tRNA(Arg) A34 adenosine deaminase TadA
MKRLLIIAYKASQASTHPVHKMAAVVVRGGKIIASEHNLARLGAHCELRALRPHADLRGATLVVVRSNGYCSRPCPRCHRAIQLAGIKKIVFVDELRQVAVEKL